MTRIVAIYRPSSNREGKVPRRGILPVQTTFFCSNLVKAFRSLKGKDNICELNNWPICVRNKWEYGFAHIGYKGVICLQRWQELDVTPKRSQSSTCHIMVTLYRVAYHKRDAVHLPRMRQTLVYWRWNRSQTVASNRSDLAPIFRL